MSTMPGEPHTPILPEGLPDDWVQRSEVRCPRCRYDLRMLRAPRCPECGLVFRWQTLLNVNCPRCGETLHAVDDDECPGCDLVLNWALLLDRAAAVDHRLYEYSRRPVRAALRTWVAVLNPWGFWRGVPLEAPPNRSRLRRLRWAAVLICVAGLLILAAQTWTAARGFVPRIDLLSFLFQYSVIALFAMALMLPLVTTISLPRFTPTWARVRIRRDQVTRCLVYAISCLVWIGLLGALAGVAGWIINLAWPVAAWRGASRPRVGCSIEVVIDILANSLSVRSTPGFDPALIWFNCAIAAVLLGFGFVWWWVFLYVGLRQYLRLNGRDAVALLLSTQLIGLLTLMIVLTLLTGMLHTIGKLLVALENWLFR